MGKLISVSLVLPNNIWVACSELLSVEKGSQKRGPWAACGPRGRSVRPAMVFGNFQIMNIYIAKCVEKRCREIIESKLNDTQCGFRPGPSTTDQVSISSNF